MCSHNVEKKTRAAPTVLIIEPEKSQRNGLNLALEHSRISVLMADDPHHGSRVLTKVPVDLIVTEINFSFLDGIEALHMLRKKAPRTPIIVTSAFW